MNGAINNPVSRPVGRPREFDEEAVLHAAMEVFWHKGYESTSMADLLAATRLHKGSLYQAFGDKRSLFISTLRHYIDRMHGEMNSVMNDADNALEGLRSALYKVIDMGCGHDTSNPGCMALNTLVEKGTTDEAILALLKESYMHRVAKISQAVARAQLEGRIRKDWPAEQAAGMIHAMLAGLTVSVKGPLNEEQAKAMIDDFLAALG